ncbi:LamB/YcsF family protein [Rubritalea spongiae]|uniref:LamB/YcsF family protein n=1 Tax=Rubritalea spongiae TaxID=430797 RepID=A0ABW5E1W9_9BACT
MPEIFLNCDLGEWESPAQTASLMPYLHMANIACGGHAGSTDTIAHCQQLAESQKPIAVSAGAHPGVADTDGSRGRTLPDHFSVDNFTSLLEIQIQRYIHAADLNHIKLHGALYHLTESDETFRQAFLEFVRNRCLISIVCLAGGEVAQAAEERGMPILPEIFLDRHYQANGQLLERSHPDALITDANLIVDRLEQLKHTHTLTAHDGTIIHFPNHYDCLTACVHSDSPNSLEILKAAREYLERP